jgi:hypothetical protein
VSNVTTASHSPDRTAKAGTIAGATAFLAGGVGTILAAIGDFGGDTSALGAARRNHVDSLIAAAALAALGLALGGVYPFLRHRARTLVLAAGVVAVAAGVAVGAFATIAREPGRPTIVLQRVDKESVRVEITGDGLASSDWYEAIVTELSDLPQSGPAPPPLAEARFSPSQNGKLDWKARIDYPASTPTTTYLLVRVQKDRLLRDTDCKTDKDVTCLYVHVPPSVARTG